MSVRMSSVCVALLVLAGCGGDGGDPEPMQGVLAAGEVAGVRYATSTSSGTTDAAGGFQCTPGKLIYFSVGATPLGSSVCATRISLFTLAGTSPPTTERALRRELDRARRMATPFTTAMNLDRLLLALDADRNPANGLDVRDRAARLETVVLDVSLSRDAFEAALYRQVPEATRNLAPDYLVAHLYHSVGIDVSVHAPLEIRNSTNLGLLTTTHFFDFAPRGTLSHEGTDYTGDGIADSHYYYEHDTAGRLLAWRGEQDSDFDGTVDGRFALRRDYSSNGDFIAGGEDYDDDGDGDVDRRIEFELAYDSRGVRTGDTVRTDSDNDGVFDSGSETSFSYGSDGQVSSITSASDTDGDGVTDSLQVASFRWVARDRLQSETRASDDDADGVVDNRTVLTHEYLAGGVTRLVVETFAGANVAPDSRLVQTTTSDARGNALSYRIEDDYGADGTIDQSSSSLITYDADSRELTRLDDQDYDGNGVFDSRNATRSVFDDAGNRVELVNEFFQSGGTQVAARYVSRSEVGAGGEPLITVGHSDGNADGFTDFRSEELPTYRVVADGARLLAQWYFQRSN
jgi:hypothetical protein